MQALTTIAGLFVAFMFVAPLLWLGWLTVRIDGIEERLNQIDAVDEDHDA